MARWKLFSKSKKDKITDTEKTVEEETEEIIREESEEKPLAEYSETLYSGKATVKKGSIKHSGTPPDQRIWRDVDSIENKIDILHVSRAQKPITEIDKRVDNIITEVDVKEEKKDRKLPNVIYVVSRPQPGEVRGDWAVRSHSKIFSHHKTKEKAIEKARKIAKKKDASVLIQNTDGTFSDGFKPR